MAWYNTSWLYRRAVTVTNNSGGVLTDHAIRIKLSAANFAFAKANSDGSDLRITTSDETTLVNIWKEKYDNSGQDAWVFFKATLSTGLNTFYLYYGNSGASDADDPDNVFLYYNALAAAGDLTDISDVEDASSTWTVVTDANSPNGNAVDVVESGAEFGRSKTITFSVPYTVEVHIATTHASSDGWAGPFMNRADGSNWYRPAPTAIHSTTWGGQMRTDGSSSQPYPKQLDNETEDLYSRHIASYHPDPVITGTAVIDLSARTASDNLQGAVYDPVTDRIYASSSGSIYRYQLNGTVDEEVTTTGTGGGSWGDLCVVDGTLYVVWFNGTTLTEIYEFTDLADLAGSKALAATLTTDFTNAGANALTHDGTNFLIGETDSGSPGSIRLHVFNSSWTQQKEMFFPQEGFGASVTVYGVQGWDMVGDQLYACSHDGLIYIGQWDAVAQDYELTAVLDSTITNAQGITYDSDNDKFYICDRIGEQLLDRTFVESGSVYHISSHLRSPRTSGASIHQQVSSPNTQDEFGIGGFRSSRFAQLTVRPWTLNEPVPVVAPEENVPSSSGGGTIADEIFRVYGTGIASGLSQHFSKTASESLQDAEARWLVEQGATAGQCIEDMWIEAFGDPGEAIAKVQLDYWQTQ